MSEQSSYLKAAKELRGNEGQWAAYQSNGHCVVLAGPGSGKTKTLTVKLARILAEEVKEPRGVACITYNNECAREIENRLFALGIEPGGRLFVGTVHSFSLKQVVLPYAKVGNLGLPDEFSIATRSERATALERAYARVIQGPGNPQDWDFRMGNYRRSILDRTGPQWRSVNAQLAELVEAYEDDLRKQGLIDFDDMPLLAVRALKENEWLRRALLAKFPVLVVDEYQDLGRALHRMVMGLCFSAGMRLFAVGDGDQSIYGFIGAQPELLQKLSDRDDVETVRLKLNYRCGSNIVTASGYALGEDRGYKAKDDAPEGTIYFHPLNDSYQAHAEYLFTEILPNALARVPDAGLGDIAILYPAAWIGDAVADAAHRHGYATIRTDSNSLYPRSSPLMRWLEQCAQWCCSGWRTGEPRFSRLANEGRRMFSEALPSTEDRLMFERRLLEALWDRRDGTIQLSDWLSGLNSDFLSSLVPACPTLHDDAENLDVLIERTLPGAALDEMTLQQFSGQTEGSDCINLSTLHSSKGREFSIVVMFGMDSGRIPRFNANAEQISESRRLFYVGFTRAEIELHMVYVATNPSPFVTEVQDRIG